MNRIARRALMGHEDLMQELENMEQKLLEVDSAAAMELMVLETKLRERFERMEKRMWSQTNLIAESIPTENEPLSELDIQNLIPQDLPLIFNEEDSKKEVKRRLIQTVAVAGLLAVITAAGVFGLASLIHMIVNRIA